MLFRSHYITLGAHTTASLTLGAGVLEDVAVTLAGFAGHRGHHLAEQCAHHLLCVAGPMACGACDGRLLVCGSGAFAVLAGAVGRKLQVLFRTEHGGLQIYGELFELIAAGLATWYRTVAGTTAEGVEELSEHVAHVESAERLAATVSRSTSGSLLNIGISRV